MLSIEEIKNISFRKASLGGYKPEDVDTFIDQVLITMEQLRKEKSDLIKKMDILATRVEEYRADEDAVRNALLSAQRVADTTIKEARAKAAKILDESENLAKAKLYDLNVQIKQQKKQYTLLLAEYNHVRDDIINHCNKHISLLKEIPSEDRIKSMEKSINERFPTERADEYERAEEFAPIDTEDKAPVADTAENVNVNDAAAVADEKQVELFAGTDLYGGVSEEDSFDVNIVSDIGDRDVLTYQKKKNKSFVSLKFGDDYDINNDDGDADSDINT
ncbi:MAG: DivIVA domain-containing protein [Ruminococcus sp.]|nr:DivIVA domain-containing protein [Ruminococcus sp.]